MGQEYCVKHGVEYEQGGCWLCCQEYSIFSEDVVTNWGWSGYGKCPDCGSYNCGAQGGGCDR